MRLRLSLFVVVTLVLTSVACGGSGESEVVKVSAFPWPEGPSVPAAVAATNPASGTYVPLSEIAQVIPKKLPENPPQTCEVGAKVQLTLKSGRVITYGPCNRPASIERLRLALIRASRRHG